MLVNEKREEANLESFGGFLSQKETRRKKQHDELELGKPPSELDEYAPNIGAPQYVRQILTSMKGEINNNIIIVGDFNTPESVFGA